MILINSPKSHRASLMACLWRTLSELDVMQFCRYVFAHILPWIITYSLYLRSLALTGLFYFWCSRTTTSYQVSLARPSSRPKLSIPHLGPPSLLWALLIPGFHMCFPVLFCFSLSYRFQTSPVHLPPPCLHSIRSVLIGLAHAACSSSSSTAAQADYTSTHLNGSCRF